MHNHTPPASSATRIIPFRHFLCFRFCLTFAAQMQAVVVGWQIYTITGSALTLGFIGLAEALPYIATSLFGGHVADAYDRRRINLVCAAVFTLCSMLLLAITVVAHDAGPNIQFLYYAVIFITGIGRGFLAPSVAALFAQIVPRRLYLNGSAWSSNVWHTAAVAGPAAGGIVYGTLGVIPAYLCLIAVAATSLVFMWKIPTYPLDFVKTEEPMGRSIAKGVRFVFSNQVILAALALDLIAVLFGGAVAVLPVFASEVLNTGPQGLGYLRAAPFLGSVMMGFYLAGQRPMRRGGHIMLWSVAGFGLCMIVFALSKMFWLSFGMLFLSGILDSVSVVVRATILQLLMPDEMRGRISAVNNIFVGTSNELGAFESGVAAHFLGLVPSVVLGGLISIAAVVATAAAAPKLRRLDLRALVETSHS